MFNKQEINIKRILKSNGQYYPVRESRDRIFSPKEWKKFINSIKENKKMIFKFLINTGARINEAIHVEKKDINLEKKHIILRVTKKRSNYSDGKPRVIKISSEFSEELKEYLSNINQSLLFPVTKQSVFQLFKRGLRRAGLNSQEFSLHNIRKTIESWLAYLGVHSFIISKHFGHNYETAIKHYVQPDLYSSRYKFGARLILGDLYM